MKSLNRLARVLATDTITLPMDLPLIKAAAKQLEIYAKALNEIAQATSIEHAHTLVDKANLEIQKVLERDLFVCDTPITYD